MQAVDGLEIGRDASYDLESKASFSSNNSSAPAELSEARKQTPDLHLHVATSPPLPAQVEVTSADVASMTHSKNTANPQTSRWYPSLFPPTSHSRSGFYLALFSSFLLLYWRYGIPGCLLQPILQLFIRRSYVCD